MIKSQPANRAQPIYRPTANVAPASMMSPGPAYSPYKPAQHAHQQQQQYQIPFYQPYPPQFSGLQQNFVPMYMPPPQFLQQQPHQYPQFYPGQYAPPPMPMVQFRSPRMYPMMPFDYPIFPREGLSVLPRPSVSYDSNHSSSSARAAERTSEEHIRVCVRIRPLNNNEIKRGESSVLAVANDGYTLDLRTPKLQKTFTFDFCMNEETQYSEVFYFCGVTNLIDMAMYGYSTTVLAYGQTGSGKTFTIVGKEDQPQLYGIIPRAAEYLFQKIQSTINSSRSGSFSSSSQYSLSGGAAYAAASQVNEGYRTNITARCYYLEIYNEYVNDLLNINSTNLPVRWSTSDGFFVENLFIVECRSFTEMIEVMQEGVRNRRVAAHELNKDSSRSHSIFTVFLDIETIDLVDGFKSKKFGKIHFVDLAGSERLKESKSYGETAIETGHINKSLLTLGKVISHLASSKRSSQYYHIPFRDSKLTYLLMDSIGGTGKTIMIACVTPSNASADETMNTLKYAARTKRIKNKPSVNLDPSERLVQRLKEEIRMLREEIALLRASGATILPRHSLEPSSAPSPSSSTGMGGAGRAASGIKFPDIKTNPTAASAAPSSGENVRSSKDKGIAAARKGSSSVLDPRYAEILAERDRMEAEIRDLRALMRNGVGGYSGVLAMEDANRIKKENMELTKALHKLRSKLYSARQSQSGHSAGGSGAGAVAGVVPGTPAHYSIFDFDQERMSALKEENRKLKKKLRKMLEGGEPSSPSLSSSVAATPDPDRGFAGNAFEDANLRQAEFFKAQSQYLQYLLKSNNVSVDERELVERSHEIAAQARAASSGVATPSYKHQPREEPTAEAATTPVHIRERSDSVLSTSSTGSHSRHPKDRPRRQLNMDETAAKPPPALNDRSPSSAARTSTESRSSFVGDSAKPEYNTEEMDEHEAATKIQALYRGSQVRKYLKEQKEERPPQEYKQMDENEAATKIQALQRGRQVRKELKAQKEAYNQAAEQNQEAELREQEEAATKIQAAFRGNLARKRLRDQEAAESGEQYSSETAQQETEVYSYY